MFKSASEFVSSNIIPIINKYCASRGTFVTRFTSGIEVPDGTNGERRLRWPLSTAFSKFSSFASSIFSSIWIEINFTLFSLFSELFKRPTYLFLLILSGLDNFLPLWTISWNSEVIWLTIDLFSILKVHARASIVKFQIGMCVVPSIFEVIRQSKKLTSFRKKI